MSRVTSFSEWLLRQAVIWGGLACLAFYALVVQPAGEGTFLNRYFAGHTVAYCTTALFFVGAAALLIKFLGIAVQYATLDSVQLPPTNLDGDKVEDAAGLQSALHNIATSLHGSYLVRRLNEALQYIIRKGTADTLEPHLRHLEETDLARMHHGYAMVRIILSTIPILGFLGTVIGITLAIAKLNLSGSAMDESLPAVVAGLSVAFDTTALALSLSTVLLFLKFCVERFEIRLLANVDAAASQQLVGRFQQYGTENDPHLASVCRMSEQLLSSVQQGIGQQNELMQDSLQQISSQWSDVLSSTTSTLDEALSGAVVTGLTRHAEALNEGVKAHAGELEETLIRHAELLNEGLQLHTSALTEAEQQLSQENRKHLAEVEAAVGEAMIVATDRQEKLIKQSENLLKEMQVALVESAGSTVSQQEQLIKQGDVLLKIVEATGQIKQLEDALNSNLNSLASSHSFQQTVAGLSAALQLLSVHLVGNPLEDIEEVTITGDKNRNQAA